jgi:putative colanic acid biosynthesis acetyltransferase WcaF
MQVDLSKFDNSRYKPGRSALAQAAWFFIGLPLLRCPIIPSSLFRVKLLRAFGASIGQGVVVKPGVRVKYPWHLQIGNNSWLGEDCWIDNLAPVRIGNNVCVSQGAYLCTGSHDWSDPSFGLITKPITLQDGAWVGARAIICPGVELEQNGIAALGSVVTRSIPAGEIHMGNPANHVRQREA